MQPIRKRVIHHINQAEVLNKAVKNAALYINLSQKVLSEIIGVSPPQISRLFNTGTICINPDTKEWDCALLFLRILRSLQSIVGEDPGQVHEWLWSYNHHLSANPIDLMKKIEGLAEVTRYLDAMRG